MVARKRIGLEQAVIAAGAAMTAGIRANIDDMIGHFDDVAMLRFSIASASGCG